MALVSVIRRWHLREGVSIREIARRTNLSRNTIRKYLANGELPDAFRKLQAILLKRTGGDREMVEVLSLVLHHDEQAVLCAVELALEAGPVSKQHILNILSRLLDAAPPAPVDAPTGLRLSDEPKANVTRYDHLRGQVHAG